jgi:phosphonate metabolism protein (transferase hexapeptide repeat family)
MTVKPLFRQKMLGEVPHIDETAVVVDSVIGRWTEIRARSVLMESFLGDFSYVVNDCHIIYADIGKFCSIAAFARLNPGNHPLQRAALHHFSYRSRQFGLGEDDADFFQWRRSHPVKLGHDVWVGHGAVVLPGVSIGAGAAVGAGSVVTRDVPAFTVVAGVPAKPIRERFPKAIQDALLRIAWWEWSHPQLREALDDFRRLDAVAFAAKYDPQI